MRVERLKIGSFGRLRGLDTGEAPLPGFVAVHGPNEAGKTTFFHFLTTLLYGFQPASRDTHPYTPWHGGDIEGGGVLRMGGGEAWEVRRRLRSTPAGSLVRAGREEELRNRPLPCAEHVPLAVFRQVFALTLAELAGLESQSWAVVQDRLLGSMGMTDLRPARDVTSQLEREAGELWRPSRRGKQRVRDLQQELVALKGRRTEALEADRRLRERSDALERTRQELTTLREERAACRAYLERHRALAPVRAHLRRIRRLEDEAGDVRQLEGLPADPQARLAESDALLRALDDDLERSTEEARDPRSRAEAYGPGEERLVRRNGDVRALLTRAAEPEGDRARRGQLEQEIRDLDRRAEAIAAELFRSRWTAAEEDALRALAIGALRDVSRGWGAAREEGRLATEAMHTAESQTKAESRAAVLGWSGWAVVALGLLALVTGAATENLPLAVLGAPLLVLGALLLLAERGARGPGGAGAAARERAERARVAEEEARTAVVAHLNALPMRDSVLAAPDAEVVGALERLQELVRDRQDRAQALAALDAREAAVSQALATLCSELGLETPTSLPAGRHLLTTRLAEAEARRGAAEGARRELERLTRERARMERERARLTEEAEGLRGRLAALGAGHLADGIRAARGRMEARALADRLRRELEAAQPDLPEVEERIGRAEAAGEDWTLDEEAVERQRTREEVLADRIEQLGRETAEVGGEVARLEQAVTADQVEGEILLLEEQLDRARRERDRRWLLACIVREAERTFRDEHQPDVIRRAGAHFARITDGRYDRILVGNGGEPMELLLQSASLSEPVRLASAISTGTREQVYMALRLAIVDHLDQGGERLPLFIDEAFVNWDPDRMERGLELLQGVSAERQVFLFSCHPGVVERARLRGAGVVNLSVSD